MTQIFNEVDFIQKKKQKNFFIGVHVGYGMYNLRLPKWITTVVDTEYKEKAVINGRNAYYE